MPVTRESLEARIAGYKTQREQILANANALNGAIQAVEAILKDLEPETPEVVDAQLVTQ